MISFTKYYASFYYYLFFFPSPFNLYGNNFMFLLLESDYIPTRELRRS